MLLIDDLLKHSFNELTPLGGTLCTSTSSPLGSTIFLPSWSRMRRTRTPRRLVLLYLYTLSLQRRCNVGIALVRVQYSTRCAVAVQCRRVGSALCCAVQADSNGARRHMARAWRSSRGREASSSAVGPGMRASAPLTSTARCVVAASRSGDDGVGTRLSAKDAVSVVAKKKKRCSIGSCVTCVWGWGGVGQSVWHSVNTEPFGSVGCSEPMKN
jgi:hypothetical protein